MSEWEYDHDDYWDQDAPMQRKRSSAREDTNEINDGPKKKRSRVDYKKDIPWSSLESYNTTAPTVIWRSKYDQLSPQEEPIYTTGQGEKVALLKDWKERFECQTNLTASQPESKRTNRRGSQMATAVVIGEDPLETKNNSTTQRPATLKKAAAGLPSSGKTSPYTAVNNGTTPHMPNSDLISGEGRTSNRLVRNTSMAGKKRTIDELPNHEENALPAPKKRLRTPKKNNIHNPQIPKQPLANRTNGSVPASRKRKADDSDDRSVTSPRKRTDTAKMKGGELSTSEANGFPVRRTTRRNR